MEAKPLFVLFVIVIICSILELGKTRRGIGRGSYIQGRSKKGKKATLKSLEEDIKELREQIEALPKNVVNLHMHGTGSELQNENVEEAIEITNSTLGDKKSKDDEIRSDANIHVHMQLVEYSEKCAKDDEEIHAHCEVEPNENLADGDDITGAIHFIQKGDNPVDVYIDLSGFDMTKEPMVHTHGFHIHHYGDLSKSCDSLGGHFNPVGVNHGSRKSKHSHVGDLGNIECDMNGEIDTHMTVDKISLRGESSLIGRSIVIHAGPDDLGSGENPGSHKHGNAGGRIACCVIALANPAEHQHHTDHQSKHEQQHGHVHGQHGHHHHKVEGNTSKPMEEVEIKVGETGKDSNP